MLILLILNDDVSIAGKIFFKIERANECFVKVRFLSFFFFLNHSIYSEKSVLSAC